MVTPFVQRHGQGAGIDEDSSNPALIRSGPMQVIGMQTADQMQGSEGRNDRWHTRRQSETQMMGHEAPGFVPAVSVMRVHRDHHSRPLCGSGIIQQKGKCPERASHGDGAPRIILAVEQDVSHRLEIQRAEITKTPWRIRQADDAGCVFPSPDHGFSGYGDVRIMDKNVTSIDHGTPPTGERDCHWPLPASGYHDNR